MPVVRGTITDDAGNPLERVRVIFTLVSSTPATPVYADGGGVAVIAEWVLTDEAGEFEIELLANSELVPIGTYYRVDVGRKRLTIVVPSSAGPHDIDDLLVDTPGEVEAAPLSAHLQDETAHAAEHITFEPTGPLSSTTAQDAIVEAATEAAAGNHDHDATYVNEADHTLGQHTALGLAPQSALAAEILARAEGDLTEADLRADADDAEAAARAAADALLIPLAQKGAANGLAPLVDGLLPTAHLPALSITDVFTVNSQAAMLALAAQRGDVAVRSDLPGSFILAADDPTILANWTQLPTPTDSVISVNGQQGVVVLGAADVGADPAGTAAAQVAAIPNDGAAGTPSRRTLGAGATQAAAGNHNHDGSYSALGHNHDDRYFTEAESDGRFARLAVPNTFTSGPLIVDRGAVSGAFHFQANNTIDNGNYIGLALKGRISSADATLQDKFTLEYYGPGSGAVIDGVGLSDMAFLASVGADKLGFYQAGVNPIHFFTNGLNRVQIDGDGNLHARYELEVDGALNHDGATAGFFSTAPVAQPAAVADPSLGAIIDIQARAQLVLLLNRIRSLGLIAT